ncbi:Sec-independent protein translocase subunit TatA [Haloechinothrix sp. YIM 98757]|uniref:Sec-independent protein translocase protein TatA n=1 Tax=Haloechinothrix aidingensis TaxID=2752311 RepID=A0A837ZZY5_9PSEU|nr:Sec-independent protein translocase subunit TatA [Haloechinothrix aidingensis]MBA0125824.1 Sec-independent protein translocase subunit TatA [Haloechinothrix aidingensis]
MGPFSPWQLAILVVVLVLLFGAKKLPDAARSLGRSMKIFKAETKGLREEDGADSTAETSSEPASAASSSDPDMRQLPTTQASATRTDKSEDASADEQIADLQRQLNEMKGNADEPHRNAS